MNGLILSEHKLDIVTCYNLVDLISHTSYAVHVWRFEFPSLAFFPSSLIILILGILIPIFLLVVN